MQIGERIRRDIVRPAVEIERHRIWRADRNPIFSEGYAAVGVDPRRDAESAGRQLQGHRGYALLVGQKQQRHAPHDAVGAAIDVERADIALLADRRPLTRRGQDELVALLYFAEHHFALPRAERERTKEVAVEALQPRADGFASERKLRLLDRARKDHVEAHDFGAAVENPGDDAPDFPRPGNGWRPFERRRLISRLVERDDDRGRFGSAVHRAHRAPTQRGQRVERKPPQPIQSGRRGDGSGNQDYRGDSEWSRTTHASHPRVQTRPINFATRVSPID